MVPCETEILDDYKFILLGAKWKNNKNIEGPLRPSSPAPLPSKLSQIKASSTLLGCIQWRTLLLFLIIGSAIKTFLQWTVLLAFLLFKSIIHYPVLWNHREEFLTFFSMPSFRYSELFQWYFLKCKYAPAVAFHRSYCPISSYFTALLFILFQFATSYCLYVLPKMKLTSIFENQWICIKVTVDHMSGFSFVKRINRLFLVVI